MSDTPMLDMLRDIDWNKMRSDITDRIEYLQAVVAQLEPSIVNEKIAAELIMPAISLLGRFRNSVTVEEASEEDQPNEDAIVPFVPPTL
jgi:hypothetical protein